MSTISEEKAALRREVQAAVAVISPEQRALASAAVSQRLLELELWKEANSVLLFAPMPGELDVWPLVTCALQTGRIVALPRFDRIARQYAACRIQDCAEDIQSGYFSIREPAGHCELVPLNRLDFVLVPGIAFDLHGRRLGRGKGYYDRLLANVRGVTCGTAFDEQMVNYVPVEPHDVVLNCILTPTRRFDCGRPVLE